MFMVHYGSVLLDHRVCVFIFEINVYDIFGAHNCIISRDNYVVGDKVTA